MIPIDIDTIERYFNMPIYQYQMFQITPVTIISYTHSDDCHQADHFKFIDDDGELHDTYSLYIEFYDTLKCAKFKQALDIHRIYTGNFKSKIPTITGMVDYCQRFIDDSDMDFFISNATNHQLHEEEFKELIREIEENNPEYLV